MRRGADRAVATRWLAALALAFALAIGWRPAARADAASCPTAGDETVTVSAVEPRLELRLVDGRVLRLAGLDPASSTPNDPDRGETARAALAAMLKQQRVSIRMLSGLPDRWGRFAAQAFVSTERGAPYAGGIATAAVAAGLGRYLAEPAAHACRDPLVAAEEKARQATLGLWADPYYAVLAVDDRAAFAERSGTIVLAEGRLIAVLPGPYRTKLRFAARDQGSYGGHTLSATILPRTMKTFEAQGVTLPSLIGRSLRLRGLLDLRFGPRIELAGPDDVDVVAPRSDASPPRRSN